MKKGKPLEDYLTELYELTAKASEITRNLSLAAIAIIWIFKNPEHSQKLLDSTLVVPLKWVVISLIIDLSQYIFMSMSVKIFHRVNERRLLKAKITKTQSENLLYPTFLENLTWLFFIAKIATMLVGYYYIYSYLIVKI